MATPTVVLKMGSQGPAVTKLQQYLNQLGVQVPVDGVFGMDTRTAVLAVQQRLKVTSDGIVGPNTWAALEQALQMSLNVSAGDIAATRTPAGAPGAGGAPSPDLPVSAAPGGLLARFQALSGPMKAGVALLAAGIAWALLPDKPKAGRLSRYRRRR